MKMINKLNDFLILLAGSLLILLLLNIFSIGTLAERLIIILLALIYWDR